MNTIESLITTHIRSGKHSETLLINELSKKETQRTIYKFGFGQSPFSIPEPIVDVLATHANRKDYMPVQGDPELRTAICQLHQQLDHKNWQPEQIIVGAGSKILLFSIMAALENIEVLLPAPSWVSYEPQAKLAGHQQTWLVTTFTDRWRLTPKQLDTYCQNRKHPDKPLLLVLNYPSNPTGQTYSTQELQALAEVMRRHQVLVLADEIYGLLSFNPPASIADFYPEGCIVSSGLSKWCGAGGWRLGFIYVPPELGQSFFQAIISVASETYSCASSPIQIAGTAAYQDIELATEFVEKQKKILSEISQYCTEKLQIAQIKVHTAQGGFYLFPDFSYFKTALSSQNIHTSEQLTQRIMQETGVALLPGSAFGMPPTSLTARLAFVDFNGAKLWREQIEYNKIKAGIAQLCQWLQQFDQE